VGDDDGLRWRSEGGEKEGGDSNEGESDHGGREKEGRGTATGDIASDLCRFIEKNMVVVQQEDASQLGNRMALFSF